MGSSTGYQNRAVSFFPHPGLLESLQGTFPQNKCISPRGGRSWQCLCSHRQANSTASYKTAGAEPARLPDQLTKPQLHRQVPGSGRAAVLDFWGFSNQLSPISLPFYSHAFKQQVIITANPFPTGLILRPLLKASKASHLKSTDIY